MGDNHPCEVVDISMVCFQLFHGSFFNLKDVRYALELKKKLISMGILDSMNISLKGKHGQIKVYKGSLVPFFYQLKNEFYVYNGVMSVQKH